MNDEKELPPIDLDAIERKQGLLPHLPEILVRIRELLRSGDTDVAQVSELIAGEVGLVAGILRTVNSAYYNLPRPVSDLKIAVAYMGFDGIERIVLTASLMDAFKGVDTLQFKRFLEHSYFAALSSKYIASTHEPHLDTGVLWPCALLHDVGELVYMRLFPEHYSTLVSYRQKHLCLLDEAEEACSMPSHKELGALLCDHWKLPEPIRDACLFHGLNESPSPSQETKPYRRMVIVGDLLSSLTVDNLHKELKETIQARSMELLSCSERDFLFIMGTIMELRNEVERFVGF